tara:strand:+ start:112 stop:843 length:732 start_codon:yes stop_codon:yes gene_type:complete
MSITYSNKTRRLLKDTISNKLPDNTTQSITAENIRDVTRNLILPATFAPVMIYAGTINKNNIVDKYYNPAYFVAQNESDPTASYNILKTDDRIVSGSDQTGTVFVTSPNGIDMVCEYTISSGLITNFRIVEPGGGYKVGEEISMDIGNSVKVFTYQGVIRETSTDYLYDMTPNWDQENFNHQADNTIVSATPVGVSVGVNDYFVVQNGMSSLNKLVCKYTKASGNSSETSQSQFVQIWRVPGF